MPLNLQIVAGLVALGIGWSAGQGGMAQEPAGDAVFSGPQIGEALPEFSMTLAFGERAGEALDPIAAANDRPLLLVFVHERSRPAFGLTRAVTQFCAEHRDKVSAGVCFLTADPTDTEKWLSNIQRNFSPGVPVGYFRQGIEGPGSYGLNRNVALTILVGNQGKVTGNFALVQPSLEADGQQIIESIAKTCGLEDIPRITRYLPARGGGGPETAMSAELNKLLEPLARKDLSAEEAQNTIAAVQSMVRDRPALGGALSQWSRNWLDRNREAAETNAMLQAQIENWARAVPPQRNQSDEKLTGLLRSLIQKTNSDQRVDEIAKSIEDYVATNDVARSEIARISRTIAGSDRLSNYGTPHAQEVLQRWSEKYNGKQK